MSDPSLHIGFLIFPNVTQLDFTGPWEVLTRLPGAICHLVADDLAPVVSGSGLAVVPTTTFAACPPLDILCVPGGGGHLAVMENETLLRFLTNAAPRCRYVTSVCTGALVLAAAGLLEGYRATTHWASLDRLAAFGAKPVAERVVIDRNRITGGGVTAGIDFALVLAGEIEGEAFAHRLALGIEYAPAPPVAGDPRTAEPAVLAELRARAASYRAGMAEADGRALFRLRSGRGPG